MRYYTTIEQSKNLVKLGLNPNTADALYKDKFCVLPSFIQKPTSCSKLEIPCWTVGALLDIIRKADNRHHRPHRSFYLDLWLNGICCGNSQNYTVISDYSFNKMSVINAMYKMVVLLLERKYI